MVSSTLFIFLCLIISFVGQDGPARYEKVARCCTSIEVKSKDFQTIDNLLASLSIITLCRLLICIKHVGCGWKNYQLSYTIHPQTTSCRILYRCKNVRGMNAPGPNTRADTKTLNFLQQIL